MPLAAGGSRLEVRTYIPTACVVFSFALVFFIISDDTVPFLARQRCQGVLTRQEVGETLTKQGSAEDGAPKLLQRPLGAVTLSLEIWKFQFNGVGSGHDNCHQGCFEARKASCKVISSS